ncbi:MAG: exodeoxyribonuclease VII large subunit, partial [Atopobiaceae bacterium]|nr:exodeoxyribonuclease VII large subunit [Atopobiaceae bacterium]
GCQVQGPGAPATIMRALAVAAAARPDAILLVRGGGSFEDLMTFNDEALARAVAACPVPVITGIGHEPDTSICDMVADRRCSTPTAAAESVAPAIDELAQKLDERQTRLIQVSSRIIERGRTEIDSLGERATRAFKTDLERRRISVNALASRRCLSDPESLVRDRITTLELTEERLHNALPRLIARRQYELDTAGSRLSAASSRLLAPYEAQVGKIAASLDALSPLKVLGRGYAIARDGEGHVVSRASQVSVGDELNVLLGAGSVRTTVTEIQE